MLTPTLTKQPTTKPVPLTGIDLYRAALAVFNNGPEQSTVRTTQLTNNNPNTNQEDSNNESYF